MNKALRRSCWAAAVIAVSARAPGLGARAQTLSDSLVRVYQNNLQLNAQRAQLRVTDENVPQALSGYRPQVSAGVSGGINPVKTVFPDGTSQSATLRPWMAGSPQSYIFHPKRWLTFLRRGSMSKPVIYSGICGKIA
jgi:outer membrane protein